MIKNSSKTSEFKHFKNLSDEWWDPKGGFKILHTLTPIRIKYIKNMLLKQKNKKDIEDKPLNNLSILDLGCGGGLVAEPLARLGASITGIDFIKQNIEVAKKHAANSGLNIKYMHQNLNSIKLNKKYDAILILEVLEHLSDWKKLISNIDKFLKPKGMTIISTINRTFFAKFFAIFFAENILKWMPRNTHDFEKFIKPEELNFFLKERKFEVVDLSGLMFQPILFEWHLKKNNYKINYFCSAIKTS